MTSGQRLMSFSRLVRDQEVEGSNPFVPTIFSLSAFCLRDRGPLSGLRTKETHLFQQRLITRVLAEAFHQRTGFQFGSAGIALPNRALQPLECFIAFSAIGVNLC